MTISRKTLLEQNSGDGGDYSECNIDNNESSGDEWSGGTRSGGVCSSGGCNGAEHGGDWGGGGSGRGGEGGWCGATCHTGELEQHDQDPKE